MTEYSSRTVKGDTGQIGSSWGCRQTFREGHRRRAAAAAAAAAASRSVSPLPLPGMFKSTDAGRGSQGRSAGGPDPFVPPAHGRAAAFLGEAAVEKWAPRRAAPPGQRLQEIRRVCYLGEQAALPQPVGPGTVAEVTGSTKSMQADLAVVEDLDTQERREENLVLVRVLT